MVQPKKPEYVLNWDEIGPRLKKFILIHLIRAFNENKTSELTINTLVETLSCNMGNIVKAQIMIYVENLLYYGYISYENSSKITLSDKVFDELQIVDKIIYRSA